MAIDDAGFVDEESWPLLNEMLKTGKVFVVLTTTKQQHLSPTALKVLSGKNVHLIRLSGIDKWYVSGLACQILEVFAIPVELEKYELNFFFSHLNLNIFRLLLFVLDPSR